MRAPQLSRNVFNLHIQAEGVLPEPAEAGSAASSGSRFPPRRVMVPSSMTLPWGSHQQQ